jgi:phosphate/sulfate permease
MRHRYLPNADHVPLWVELLAYTMISLGTLFGGWRIVHTMGTRITRLRPVGGFCAETGGAIFNRDVLRHPGEHHARHHRRHRGCGRHAWLLTIPAAFAISALCYLLLRVTVAP